jgi:predicted permease
VQELTKLLRFPPLLALAAAVIWRLAGLPAVPHGIDLLLRGISLVTVPLVMISLGLVLHAGAIRRAWRTAGLVSLFRLVMAPTLGWVLSQRVGLTGLQATVTTVELGMPAMMFSLMLAIQNGLDAELSAAFVTATLVGSVVSLPVWVFLLR